MPLTYTRCVVKVRTKVEEFESFRGHLIAVGYRLTGSVGDAEDAVQESWLRLAAADTDEIRDLRGWLTTVVSRICLDRLRSAAVRRESYIGQWLPEPIVTDTAPSRTPDPLESLVHSEDNRFVAMVVLDALTPPQRVAFVLHDGFAVPFEEIAAILGVTSATARQLASRARKAVASTPKPVSDAEHNEAVERFLTALAGADLAAVVATLHPEVTLTGDANGTTRMAINVVKGADHVARFMLGLQTKYGYAFAGTTPVLLNGQLGLLVPASADRPAHVVGFTVRNGRVWGGYDIANPEKLRGLRVSQIP